MSSDIEKLLKDAEDLDSSEYISNNKDENESATENDAEMPQKIKKKLNSFKNGFNLFYQNTSEKVKKVKKSNKRFTKTEDQKHDKLFQYIFKNVGLLIIAAFFLILIVAFFKVFIFSKKFEETAKRIDVNRSVDEISLGFGSESTWREETSQDVSLNRKNILIIKQSISNQTKMIENKNFDLKKYILKNMKNLRKSIQIDIGGVKEEAVSMVNDSIKKMNKKMASFDNNITSNSENNIQLNGEFVPIPSKVVKISSNGGSIVVPDENTQKNNIVKKMQKKAIQEKVIKENEIDEKIYLSTNVETIAIDSSGYDQAGKIVKDVNNTLPSIIIRQGFSNAILVTGVSAPTFNMDKNPTVVFITFKGQSVISNYFEQDVENCTATASVFGNILTRRAEMIVNKISCTFEKNKKKYMVRANVKGWVYDGNDGKLGVPGILVDSSGSILTDSALIGVLQGFGKFVSSSAQIYGRQGGNGYTYGSAQPVFNQTQVAKTNLAAGVGEQLAGGFDTITAYYQKIIDTLYPYIDVKGGRKITILFDGGETLSPKEYTPFLVNSGDMSVGDKTLDNNNNNNDDFNNMEIEVDNNDW